MHQRVKVGTLFWRTLINTVKVCKPCTKLTTKYFHREVQLDLSYAQFTHKPRVKGPYNKYVGGGAEGFCVGREIF